MIWKSKINYISLSAYSNELIIFEENPKLNITEEEIYELKYSKISQDTQIP
jgi:hypothetical protein